MTQETHYKQFLVTLSIIVIIIGSMIYIISLWDGYNKATKNELDKIQNFNCTQLWIEEKKYWNMDNTSAEFEVARQTYHQTCLVNLFGYPEPDQNSQDSYFLSISCTDLQQWIKDQRPYFDRAIVDYKEVCKSG